jgi:hypothetical protein
MIAAAAFCAGAEEVAQEVQVKSPLQQSVCHDCNCGVHPNKLRTIGRRAPKQTTDVAPFVQLLTIYGFDV